MSSDRRRRLTALFRDGARQALTRLDRAFVELEKRPEDAELRAELMRTVHTLKGDAKIAGFAEANRVAHRTEDLLIAARARGGAMPPETADLVLRGFDLVRQLIEEEPDDVRRREEAEAFTARVALLLQQSGGAGVPASPPAGPGAGPDGPMAPGESRAPTLSPAPTPPAAAAGSAAAFPSHPEPAPPPATTPPAPTPPAAAAGSTAAFPSQPEPTPPPAATPPTAAAASASMPARHPEPASALPDPGPSAALHRFDGVEDVIRISGEQLAALTSLAGTLAVRQQQLDRLLLELDRRLAGRQGQDPERRADATCLAASRAESFELQLQVRRLEEEVQQMRLRRIGELFERFPRAARDAARALGKQVRVEILGEEVTVDKQVLDELDKVLLHLVRNSVDHGLEAPTERLACGKPAEGRVRLVARRVGSRVEIEVNDDGRGLDVERIRTAAVRRGLVDPAAAASLRDDETLRLIFRPGFSTRDEVSELSGRGVGLDVVLKQVERLGGSVSCQTTPGSGSTFRFTVPVSVALSDVVIVRAGGALHALSAGSVVQILRHDPTAIEQIGHGRCLSVDGERVPFVELAELLGMRRVESAAGADVIVVSAGDARLAILVERVEGHRHVLVRALDALLAGLQVASGTIELEGGSRALLLNLPELLRLTNTEARVGPAADATAENARRRVLVVDDSAVARDLLCHVLARTGHEVQKAINGDEAWRRLLAQPPDLLLTDLDMPVLDGLTLIARVRADARFARLPIVVLSTRGSDADKRRAMDAGANAYLVKSSYDESALLATLRRLLG